MEANIKEWECIVKRVEDLKACELKYHILTEYIKNEAKDVYFDRDKILNMINILNQKKIEELKKEKNENE